MKAIIKCPTCEWKGIMQNLAEYLQAEGIVVIRRSKGFIPYQKTIIRGNDFSVEKVKNEMLANNSHCLRMLNVYREMLKREQKKENATN